MNVTLDEQLNEEFIHLQTEKDNLKKAEQSLGTDIKKYTFFGKFLILAGFLAFFIPIIFSSSETSFSDYGDYIGGVVSSIWSLAGLMFIYIAFLGQKQQLMIQQYELKHTQLETKSTRLEIIEQKKQMVVQNETIHLQRFENTFFNMLSNLNQIVNSLQTPDFGGDPTNVTLKGIDAFQVMRQAIENGDGDNNFYTLDESQTHYYYSEAQTLFESYHNLLTIILQHIDDAKLSNDATENSERKMQYFNLVITPMTFKQKVGLVYHIAASREDNPSNIILKRLEKKYKLLNGLFRQDRIICTYRHRILVDAGIHDPNDYPPLTEEEG